MRELIKLFIIALAGSVTIYVALVNRQTPSAYAVHEEIRLADGTPCTVTNKTKIHCVRKL